MKIYHLRNPAFSTVAPYSLACNVRRWHENLTARVQNYKVEFKKKRMTKRYFFQHLNELIEVVKCRCKLVLDSDGVVQVACDCDEEDELPPEEHEFLYQQRYQRHQASLIVEANEVDDVGAELDDPLEEIMNITGQRDRLASHSGGIPRIAKGKVSFLHCCSSRRFS